MDAGIRSWTAGTGMRIAALESQPARFYISGGGGGKGKGGYQLCVPDPSGWKLDRLKDGTHGFHAWRKSFDLQVRAVWAGMDKILEAMRDESRVMDGSVYARLALGQHLVLQGASELDCNYKHVFNTLRMVLNAHVDTDPMKIIDESKEQCGFEAYWLFSRAYDPLNADTEHVLLSHILALSSWSVKGLSQIESVMGEAKLRIVTYEKRMNKDGNNPIQAGMMRTICTILYNKFAFQLNIVSRPFSSGIVMARS